jgi:hypothetical protein
MNTRVAPLGLLGLSLPVAGVAAARAQAPETVFALRHCQRAHTWQSAYVRGIVPETVDLSRDAQVQEILEDGRPFITAHCTPPITAKHQTSFTLVGSERDLAWYIPAQWAPRAAQRGGGGPRCASVKGCKSAG